MESELKISRNFLLGTGFAAVEKGLTAAWRGRLRQSGRADQPHKSPMQRGIRLLVKYLLKICC